MEKGKKLKRISKENSKIQINTEYTPPYLRRSDQRKNRPLSHNNKADMLEYVRIPNCIDF